jgi:RNA polymerase sigma-70 factor, ECF subfamily
MRPGASQPVVDRRTRALEELYVARYRSFRNALATVTGSRETARDVVQEAFARALAARDSFRGDGPLAAWAWRIAMRVALEPRSLDEPWPAEGIDPQLVEPDRDPALAAALPRLPPRRRLIVFLRYFGDFSYAEISAACAVSEGTVAASLAQARVELRDALVQEGVAR